ncbi:hypothetical protein ACJ41O_011189 [Fusarium nematophilum]
MKWFSFLSTSALLGIAIASPVSPRAVAGPTHRLRVTSGGNDTAIDDKYLSCVDEVFGIYAEDEVPRDIYLIEAGDKSDRFSLHTRPENQVDHGLSLLGWGGNLFLRETVEPADYKLNEHDLDDSAPTVYSWNEFSFSGSESDKSGRQLVWNGTDDRPGFVAAPVGDGTYYIKYYDGSAYVIQNYIPVEIYLEKI